MDQSSFEELLRFRRSVQIVLETIGKNKAFYPKGGKARKALQYFLKVLRRHREKTAYHPSTHTYMIAASIERAIEVFCGKGAMANIGSVKLRFSNILKKNTSGQYRDQADLLFFLGRLRNKLGVKINSVRRSRRRKK